MSQTTTSTFDPMRDETTEVLAPGHSFESVTEKVSSLVLTPKFKKSWIFGLLVAFSLLNLLVLSLGVLFTLGVGIWGINNPVMWAFDIINFVWWIGIGHAGTLISAILLLLRQQWRTSINRFAEAMTLFAVACAMMFPLIHTGRPWLAAYWLLPYPNVMGLWPQFRSPLIWDVFAVGTYASVSFVFWFVGLVPDFATLRDRAKSQWTKVLFGVLSLGWRGSTRHWERYETAYLLLAGLATPLVLSVHTIVSFDFSVSLLPGWHSTIFPPYFVAGAIYAGFAMVLTLMIPLRWYYGLRDMITMKHLDNMAKVMLATGLIVAYGYSMESFTAWYSANDIEKFVLIENRAFGPYGWSYWCLILVYVALAVNVGMWLERFVIIVESLHRDFLPSSWAMFYPTVWDISTFIGTIGLFVTLLFLFIRFLPIISIFEMKTLLPEAGHHHPSHGPQLPDSSKKGEH